MAQWEWSEEHNNWYWRNPDGSYQWAGQSPVSPEQPPVQTLPVQAAVPESSLTYITPTQTYGGILGIYSQAIDNSYATAYSESPQVVASAAIPSYLHHASNDHRHSPRSESASAARSTKSCQRRDTKQRYIWDVDIPWQDSRGKRGLKTAVALLDTQSQGAGGNWITYELLEKVNKWQLIIPLGSRTPRVQTGSGIMEAMGSITIAMKRLEGNMYFDVDFFVCPPQPGRAYEIILGQEFLNRHEILLVNENAMLPLLIEKWKLKPEEIAAMAAAELVRQQEQAALQARREL